MRCELENLRYGYLRLIPFENQHSVLFQDAEALAEHGLEVSFPRLLVEATVFLRHVARFPRIAQVGRVEHHHAERPVGERQVAVVHQHVRLDIESTPIAQFPAFITHITKKHAIIRLVEPEHSAAAGGVKNRLVRAHFVSFPLYSSTSSFHCLLASAAWLNQLVEICPRGHWSR